MTHELDNRDLSTTQIIVGTEVDVWELVDNALENAGMPEGIGKALYNYFEEILAADYKPHELDTELHRMGSHFHHYGHLPK